ncbi:MAG: hypothetical protein ACRCTR_03090 [Actinomycetota bacterium]
MLVKKLGRRKVVMSLTAVSAALVLTGCGDDSSSSETSASAGAECAAYQQYGDLKGKKVDFSSSIVGEPTQSYLDSFKKFEKFTGVKINLEGVAGFEDQLRVRVKGGATSPI